MYSIDPAWDDSEEGLYPDGPSRVGRYRENSSAECPSNTGAEETSCPIGRRKVVSSSPISNFHLGTSNLYPQNWETLYLNLRNLMRENFPSHNILEHYRLFIKLLRSLVSGEPNLSFSGRKGRHFPYGGRLVRN